MLLVAGAAGAAALWRGGRGGYHEVEFVDQLTAQGKPIPLVEGGGKQPSTSTTFTALHGKTAYLGWVDSDYALHLIVHPLSGGADQRVDLAAPAGSSSVSWKALVARDDVLLVYAQDYSADLPTHIYARDPDTGAAKWDKSIGSSDRLISAGPMLVWDDPAHNRVVGLDPASGAEKWSTSDPKTSSGYLTTRLVGVYTHDDTDGPSHLSDDAPLQLTGTHLIEIDSDSGGRVLDVTNGHVVEGQRVAEANDAVIGVGDTIFVVTDDDGYQVQTFALADPGSGSKRPYASPAAAAVAIAPCGSGLCVLERVSSDASTTKVRKIDKSGTVWDVSVPDGKEILAVGDGILVSGADFTRFVNAKGELVDLKTAGDDAVGARINGASALLIKGTVSSYPSDLVVAGVGGSSGKVKPLGSLDKVRGESCSLSATVIVCAQDTQFQVWHLAG